jgi:hypothetical protein
MGTGLWTNLVEGKSTRLKSICYIEPSTPAYERTKNICTSSLMPCGYVSCSCRIGSYTNNRESTNSIHHLTSVINLNHNTRISIIEPQAAGNSIHNSTTDINRILNQFKHNKDKLTVAPPAPDLEEQQIAVEV